LGLQLVKPGSRPNLLQSAALEPAKDLKGWEPIGNVENNRWIARNGELVKDNSEVPGQRTHGAANIMTTEKFQDFKLHIEVNFPEGGNGGIYLRGRYKLLLRSQERWIPFQAARCAIFCSKKPRKMTALF
jgi:hypothetical protein